MDEERMQMLVEELAAQLPGDQGLVRIAPGPGDAIDITASRIGYLHLGVRFLRAAFAAAEDVPATEDEREAEKHDDSTPRIETEMSFVVDEIGRLQHLYFSRFEGAERLEGPTRVAPVSRASRVVTNLGGLAVAWAITLAIFGAFAFVFVFAALAAFGVFVRAL